ncbi:hypothetical protein CPB85DRAFT_1441068 [Mucidula mucida]|nr:hypothetical protein CPB85DRAFT_1441068 [Mucidula mucida]
MTRVFKTPGLYGVSIAYKDDKGRTPTSSIPRQHCWSTAKWKLNLAKRSKHVLILGKENAEEPAATIDVILQAFTPSLKLDGLVFVQQSAGCILCAVFEICLKRGCTVYANAALDVCKIEKRILASRFRLNLQEIPNLTSFLELPPLPITTFNKIQSQVFQAVQLGVSDENVFVGAPTGSGETVCAELVLLRPILRHQGMVDMRVEEWRRKFSGLGKETVLRASDSQFSHSARPLDIDTHLQSLTISPSPRP